MSKQYVDTLIIWYDLINKIDDLDLSNLKYFNEHSLKQTIKQYLGTEFSKLKETNVSDFIELSDTDYYFYKALDSLIKEKAKEISENECERAIERHCDSAEHKYYNY